MLNFSQMAVIPLISLVLYLFILVILLTSNQTKLSKAFRWYIISMIIWSLGSFLMKIDIPPSALFWNKILQIGFMTVPVFLLRFSYELSEDRSHKSIIRIGYVLSAILIVLAFMGHVVKSATLVNGAFQYEIGFGAYLYMVVGLTYSALALVTMISKVQKGEVNIKKVRLVIVGLSLVIIGGAMNISTTLGQYGFDIIFNSINAVLVTYSIYRNKFLEINLIVKKGLAITLYNITLFALYAVVVIVSYQLLLASGIEQVSYLVLILTPIFLLLEPIRRILQRFTTHLFYRASTDRQIILREFSNLVNSALSLDKITSTMMKAIQDGIESKNVTILLKNTSKFYIQNSTITDLTYSDYIIELHHPVVKWITDKRILLKNQIDNHVMFKGLWDSEKLVLKELQTELIVPIKYVDTLVGIVIISERTDETPYSEDETYFLYTLINNAAAIIENAKTIESIKEQAITDDLTKLYNHRYFHDTVNEFIKTNKYETFSIAMIDIDQFKIYNDLYGYSAGDTALKRIADILVDNTKDDEIVVRYAGEEFVIFYPNIVGAKALSRIEHIRKGVEEQFLLSKDIREFLTVTVGIASFPENGSNLKEIIDHADSAMYYGKQTGRNKAILYEDEVAFIDSKSIPNEVQNTIRDAYLSSIYALAATIDAKDHYTYGHSNNVASLSAALARKAGFSEEQVETVRNAGLLHDIGKVGIPEAVLSKPGFLSENEMDIMKSHVIQSINIIKHIPNLLNTVPIIFSHHERYDGTGYPRGIKGENIPILGRVICIADAFDAMTTDRPYRNGLSLNQALYELKKHSGTQFDPDLVDIFVNLVKEGTIEKLNLENRPAVLSTEFSEVV